MFLDIQYKQYNVYNSRMAENKVKYIEIVTDRRYRGENGMRIVLTTCGSRGDVQPMIALTLALMRAGHDCILAGPPEKCDWARNLGCPYLPFGIDVTAFIDSMENAVDVKSMFGFVRFVRSAARQQLDQLPKVFAGADLVIASSLMFGASTIAEKLNIAYRYIAFTPQVFPSQAHPFPVIKNQELPPLMNRVSWKAARFFDLLNIGYILNRFRKAHGLALLSDVLDHILGDDPIAACDKAVAQVPDDVAKNVIQTGYLHLELPLELDSEITDFIQKGGPIVYAGFGSMPPKDQKRKAPQLIKAAKHAGCRMIIASFWNKENKIQSESDVLFVRQASHRLLFPLMDLIIHHGGAGTTATAAEAGKPQIIVPHILDQYYHGQKLFESGVAPKPIRLQDLNSCVLVGAIKDALEDRQMKSNAAQVGRSIHSQNALALTVQAIEEAV